MKIIPVPPRETLTHNYVVQDVPGIPNVAAGVQIARTQALVGQPIAPIPAIKMFVQLEPGDLEKLQRNDGVFSVQFLGQSIAPMSFEVLVPGTPGFLNT